MFQLATNLIKHNLTKKSNLNKFNQSWKNCNYLICRKYKTSVWRDFSQHYGNIACPKILNLVATYLMAYLIQIYYFHNSKNKGMRPPNTDSIFEISNKKSVKRNIIKN